MTRAEVAVMFAKLLNEQIEANYRAKGVFSDVADGIWFAKEVEYLANIGILTGYDESGGGKYYAPYGAITRAEFAAIVSRFENLSSTQNMTFNDIPHGYWAYSYIANTEAKGWIKGYEDGGFHPESYITRAEVVTIVNRILERTFNRSIYSINIIPYDVSDNYWAFHDILEAMNGHNLLDN